MMCDECNLDVANHDHHEDDHDHHDDEEEEKDCHDTCWVHVYGMDMNCEDGCEGCFDFPMGHCERWCYENLCNDNGCATCHGSPEGVSMGDMIA